MKSTRLLVITVGVISLSACTKYHILPLEKDSPYEIMQSMNDQLVLEFGHRRNRVQRVAKPEQENIKPQHYVMGNEEVRELLQVPNYPKFIEKGVQTEQIPKVKYFVQLIEDKLTPTSPTLTNLSQYSEISTLTDVFQLTDKHEHKLVRCDLDILKIIPYSTQVTNKFQQTVQSQSVDTSVQTPIINSIAESQETNRTQLSEGYSQTSTQASQQHKFTDQEQVTESRNLSEQSQSKLNVLPKTHNLIKESQTKLDILPYTIETNHQYQQTAQIQSADTSVQTPLIKLTDTYQITEPRKLSKYKQEQYFVIPKVRYLAQGSQSNIDVLPERVELVQLADGYSQTEKPKHRFSHYDLESRRVTPDHQQTIDRSTSVERPISPRPKSKPGVRQTQTKKQRHMIIQPQSPLKVIPTEFGPKTPVKVYKEIYKRRSSDEPGFNPSVLEESSHGQAESWNEQSNEYQHKSSGELQQMSKDKSDSKVSDCSSDSVRRMKVLIKKFEDKRDEIRKAQKLEEPKQTKK